MLEGVDKKLVDKKCPFCSIEKSGLRILLQTIHFTFIEHKYSPVVGHAILVYNTHIPEEKDIDRWHGNEYLYASRIASEYIIEKFNISPLAYIPSKHQQTASHFHKHYFPANFGPQKIEESLYNLQKQYAQRTS